jgi:hypothetical protein
VTRDEEKARRRWTLRIERGQVSIAGFGQALDIELEDLRRLLAEQAYLLTTEALVKKAVVQALVQSSGWRRKWLWKWWGRKEEGEREG